MPELINVTGLNFPFHRYSSAHLIPLGFLLSFAIAIYIFRGSMRKPRLNKSIRYTMAALLFLQEIAYQVWVLNYGNWQEGSSLPLHLCGLSALIAGVMLANRSYALFEIVYFWGLAGASQALLTPALENFSFPHYLYYNFFFCHIGIILSVLFMTWVEQYRPTLKSVGRVIIMTNLYAGFIGIVNYFTSGNYLYLCKKPPNTLLDYLGPWPWYIVSLEIMMILLFFVCYIPYLNSGDRL